MSGLLKVISVALTAPALFFSMCAAIALGLDDVEVGQQILLCGYAAAFWGLSVLAWKVSE